MKTRIIRSIIYAPFILLLFLAVNLNAQTVPSDLMRNCDQWKITYPTGEEDKTLCGEANNEFFFVNNSGDGMVFRAPVRSDNGTTPNSSYIRSELRERTEDGGSDIYWTTEGRHVLYVEQAITHLPIVKDHLVATQIHGDKAAGIDDALVLRLEGQHLFLSFNGEKLRSDVTIKTDYVLGTKHEVMFEVLDDKHYVYYSEDGNLWSAYSSGNAAQYLVKDNGESILMDLNYDQSYFKVGNYTQSNPEKEGSETDEPNNYGEVVVYDFIVEHGDAVGPVAVSGVELSPSTVTLSEGTSAELSASVNPSNATNQEVSYSSNKTSVATVNSNGEVFAISKGTATITITTDDGNYTATSVITVEEDTQSSLIPADLMRNCDQWKITYPTGGEVKQLCVENNNEFFYVNDNEDAIVFTAPIRSDNGTTTNSTYIRSELRERTEDGSADIYWTTTGRHVLYVEQAITHLPIVKPHLVATQIHGNKADGIDDSMVLRLEEGHLFLSFNGAKLRSDVTIKTDYVLGTKHEVIFEVINGKHYCYYSEDGNLLNAYQNGDPSVYYVKDEGSEVLMDLDYDQTYFKVGNYTQSNPEKEGSETDNPENYGEVLVYDFLVEHGFNGPIAVTGVELAPSNATIAVGSTISLEMTINPIGATDQEVNYSSSNSTIASVNSNGVVSGVSKGVVTITVSTNDGDFKDYTEITVQEVPQGLENIALNKSVTATATPEVDNPATALVDGNTSTRISAMGMPQTITIDLGANFDITYSELVFHNDRAYQYTMAVATSENGPYTEVVDRSLNTTQGTIGNPLTDYFIATGRYVQLTVTGADVYDGEWVSISEFRVFGEEALITSSTEEYEVQLSVYPIPASDVLNYNIGNVEGAQSIELYDLSGRLILSKELTQQKGNIDVSELSKGMYLVKIEGEVSFVKRFSKN